MKAHLRIVCFLLLTTLIYSQTYAQDGRKVRLGLQLSPNIGWISPDNQGYNREGVKAGIQYGLNADFRLFGDENYSFSTGFLISHLGGEMSYADAHQTELGTYVATETEANYNLRYIDIPLAIKLRTSEIGYMYYWGLFGAEVGWNIKANADLSNDFESNDGEDVSDAVQAFRSDLIIGGGLEYNLSGKTRLVAGLIYHNGLTNIVGGKAYLTDNNQTVIDNGFPVEDKERRNRLHYLALHLGVMF